MIKLEVIALKYKQDFVNPKENIFAYVSEAIKHGRTKKNAFNEKLFAALESELGLKAKYCQMVFTEGQSSVYLYVEPYDFELNQLIAGKSTLSSRITSSNYSRANEILKIINATVREIGHGPFDFFEECEFKGHSILKFTLNIYLFSEYSMMTTYLMTKSDINKMLEKDYSIYDICLIPHPRHIATVLNTEVYDEMKRKKVFDEIVRKAYLLTKKYDYFNCISQENYAFIIYDKSKTNPGDVGVDFRDWH